MKIVMLIVGVLFSANAFGLGAFEAFDFNSGYQPIGASLGNVCYSQGMLKATVVESDCVTTWVVDSEDQGSVFPADYELTNDEWIAQGRSGKFGATYAPEQTCTNARTVTKTLPMKRQACLEWETYVVNEGDGDGDEFRSRCVKAGTADLPRTQRLDVYIKEIGQNLTSGQNMGSAMYTIPNCEATGDLPDTDVPDTKK